MRFADPSRTVSNAKADPVSLIRPARRQEVSEAQTVLATAFAEFRDRAPRAIWNAYQDDLRRLEQRWDDAVVLVAEIGGRIAGTVSFYADASLEGLGLPAEYSGFRSLAVDPQARGRGVARMLVQECIDRAQVLNSAGVAIHTASFMQTACRIYEGMGFHRWPEHDCRASEILGVDAAMGEVMVIAYRLNFIRSRSGRAIGPTCAEQRR
jgi:GNAT superfamily N-acetyltransferase